MYKLILATHEMCGHSNSDFKIVNSDKGYEETMNEIINYDGEAMYKFSHKEKYEQYGLSGDIFYFSAIIFWTFGSGFGEVLGSSLKGRLSPYSSNKTLIQPAIGMATMAPTRPNM